MDFFMKIQIRKFRELPIFRERLEIFKKFQKWLVGDKKILWPSSLVHCARMLRLDAIRLCPQNGLFKPLCPPPCFLHFHVLWANLNNIFQGHFLFWALLHVEIWDFHVKNAKNSQKWVLKSIKMIFFKKFWKIWIPHG